MLFYLVYDDWLKPKMWYFFVSSALLYISWLCIKLNYLQRRIWWFLRLFSSTCDNKKFKNIYNILYYIYIYSTYLHNPFALLKMNTCMRLCMTQKKHTHTHAEDGKWRYCKVENQQFWEIIKLTVAAVSRCMQSHAISPPAVCVQADDPQVVTFIEHLVSWWTRISLYCNCNCKWEFTIIILISGFL